VVLVSDRVRKQLPDLVESPGAGGVDEGLHTPEARGRVYAALLERARTVVAAGPTAILDAT
jgi:predicted kinase